MARPGVTLEQVMAAADRLAASGQRPSVRLIREHLGDTGSPNTSSAFWRNGGSLGHKETSRPLKFPLLCRLLCRQRFRVR